MAVRPIQFFGTVTLALGFFTAGATLTHQASAQTAQPALRGQRGERGSARNIAFVEKRLGRLIATLQRDQRDYGGHRVNAINLLQQADQQLDAAIQVDATTPH